MNLSLRGTNHSNDEVYSDGLRNRVFLQFGTVIQSVTIFLRCRIVYLLGGTEKMETLVELSGF